MRHRFLNKFWEIYRTLSVKVIFEYVKKEEIFIRGWETRRKIVKIDGKIDALNWSQLLKKK